MQIILVFIVFQFVIFIYFSIWTLILKSFTQHCMQSLLFSLMEKALGNSPTLGVKSCCMQSLSNPEVDPTWLMGYDQIRIRMVHNSTSWIGQSGPVLVQISCSLNTNYEQVWKLMGSYRATRDLSKKLIGMLERWIAIKTFYLIMKLRIQSRSSNPSINCHGNFFF